MLVLVLIIFLGTQATKAKKYKIGFSQCTTDNLWRKTQMRLMEIEMAFYPDLTMVVKDANDNTEKQITQIEEFLNDKVDLLIVSPNESAPIAPVVEKVFAAGIPVIVIDRKIDSELYTTFIGGDNYSIGIEAGNYVAKLLKGSGNIIEILGLEGSSPAKERHQGFTEVLSAYPDIKIVRSVYANWKPEKAKEAIQKVVNDKIEFDLIFAQNDLMAKEAYSVLSRLGEGKKYILGVDGLPGIDGGIQMVRSGILDATFLYQTGGALAIQTANKILTNQPVPRQSIIPTITIEPSNAGMLKNQTDQIEILQNKIERQKLVLAIEMSRNRTQKLILLFLIAVLILATALAIVVFTAFRSKKNAHAKLELKNLKIEKQNSEIRQQRDKLVEVSKQLEDATQSKLTFFTNISHELRTPLTLIKGPIESMIETGSFTPEQNKMLRIMRKNTTRLLQMVNQLMDFREMGSKNHLLEASENNIIEFLDDIKDSFMTYADSRNIRFKIKSKENNLKVWFDYSKIDKVFFNLLSNAFKFTPNGGSITINVSKKNVSAPGLFSEEIRIDITDTGIGIPSKHLSKIFERFFHTDHSKGTGIGLNFSKELIELHRGRITVKSEEGKGSTFSIFLPLGNLHLKKNELLTGKTDVAKKRELVILFDDEEQQEIETAYFSELNEKPMALVVDDIADVRYYIIECLGENFQVIESTNGKEALEKVQEHNPDVIISDVMMPQMDGFEFTRKLKSDTNTNHIPVILLTAKASPENKLEGIEGGADCFIEKPFDCKLLRASVFNLLKSRTNLRNYFRDELEFESNEENINRMDRHFLERIKNIVLKNIENKELSIDDIGQQMGISRVHLYRKVKKLTEMSVSEFATSVKLKKSLELLRNSGKTISEIAYETGFSSPSYYTRCFKNQFKMSPSEYIQLNSKNEKK